jgi:DNA-binding MarR family transcriptional regulator
MWRHKSVNKKNVGRVLKKLVEKGWVYRKPPNSRAYVPTREARAMECLEELIQVAKGQVEWNKMAREAVEYIESGGSMVGERQAGPGSPGFGD